MVVDDLCTCTYFSSCKRMEFSSNFLDIMFDANFHNSDTALQNKGSVNFAVNIARVTLSMLL